MPDSYALDKSTRVPNLTGGNTWSGVNTFDGKSGNSNLAAIGIDEEGYPVATYGVYPSADSTSADNGVKYTSTSKRLTGPSVVIESPLNELNANSTEGYAAGMRISGNLYGDMVYNAIWNDVVDCIEVPENTDLEYGYCYSFDGENYHRSSKYMDTQFIAIHSDSYGYGIGLRNKELKQLKACIAGFVLAYVDKEYKPGTPLTCTENGYLTEMKQEDIERYPWMIVGTFWKPEGSSNLGNSVRNIEVNGRMWVKVR